MILMTEGEEVTCVGMCKGLGQGENITAEGEYIEHPVYGRQFKIQTYETVTPTDRVGMERYLGSGAIRGVGEACLLYTSYTGVFDLIRDLFASTADAKAKGYSKGRFSFNVKGGRCEACLLYTSQTPSPAPTLL